MIVACMTKYSRMYLVYIYMMYRSVECAVRMYVL